MKYKDFYKEEGAENLTFRIESVGYHHGQSDLVLYAEQNKRVVGKVEFSVFENIPYIQWIEVMDTNKRRSGIGKRLIKYLQQQYPNSEINIGGTTDLGTKFFNSLPKTFEKNVNYEMLTKRLQALKNAEKRLIAYVEKTGDVSERLSKLFNKISDELWETEEALKDASPGKTKFNIPEIVESYPMNWNLETFKSLKSFNRRIQYCNENLKRISSGSSRIAYKIDEEKVLKLARNEKGIAQNSVERDWYVQDAYEDIVAKVFDVDENDLWIEMELAKKIGPARFKSLTGVTADEVGMYLQELNNRDNSKPPPWRRVDDETRNKLDQNEWVQRVYTLCREVDLAPGDFGKVNSFGEVSRGGKPAVVIIDMGLSNAVYQDHYSESVEETMFPKDFDRNRLGSCMSAAALATDYLLSKGIADFKVVEGWITLDPDWEETGNMDSHTWLEVRGKIFDPTKKQFKNWYGDDYKNIQYVKVKKKYTPQEYQSVCRRQS